MSGANANRWYHATAIFSVVFALAGFSYNVWRMEASEHNNSVREASFEILLQLADLEQLVYAAHYDKDPETGNPRAGWVKVALIADLSTQTSDTVQQQAAGLREVWGQNWSGMHSDRSAADSIVAAIDVVRAGVRERLNNLE